MLFLVSIPGAHISIGLITSEFILDLLVDVLAWAATTKHHRIWLKPKTFIFPQFSRLEV